MDLLMSRIWWCKLFLTSFLSRIFLCLAAGLYCGHLYTIQRMVPEHAGPLGEVVPGHMTFLGAKWCVNGNSSIEARQRTLGLYT